MNITFLSAICVVLAFIVSAITGPVIIPVLKKLKFGQKILEIGPKWHEGKSGTPTMGGFIFIISASIVSVCFIRDLKGVFAVVFPLLCGAIGFIDDYIKVVKKRNLGLSPMGKIILMLIVTIGFCILGIELNIVQTTLHIPFTHIHLEFGYFISIFYVFMMIGFINSVNLTDGIDGLAGTVTTFVMLFFVLMSMTFLQTGLTIYSSALCGALCGFLIYNLHPAKVFMGDTGSLYLGGAVVALSILNDDPLIIVIVGVVYLLEAISVMLQVGYFKITHGKRLFKMAPFHHHLEMSGYTENRIVILLSTITVFAGVIAYLSLI